MCVADFSFAFVDRAFFLAKLFCRLPRCHSHHYTPLCLCFVQTTSQLEHLQSKYSGTGHADTTKFEWAVNMKRDTYASIIGQDSLLTYLAVAHNEPKERLRCRYLKVCLLSGDVFVRRC